MSRELDPLTETASKQSVIVPVWFVKLAFDGGNLNLSTYDGPIVWNGGVTGSDLQIEDGSALLLETGSPFLLESATDQIYIGAGAIGNISQIEETTELARSSISMQLRGLPDDIIAIVENEHFQGRRASIFLGYLDQSTRQLLGEPTLLYRGRMDTATIDEGDQCSVTLTIESRFADWDKAKVRRYNDGDQQARFPGDRGLEFVAQAVQGKVWGMRSPQ